MEAVPSRGRGPGMRLSCLALNRGEYWGPRLNCAPGAFSLACLFLALPVFATYFALRVKNLIVAAVLTWVALWIPEFLVQAAFVNFVGDFEPNSMTLPPIFLSYSGFALLACFLLRHSLSRRIYSF